MSTRHLYHGAIALAFTLLSVSTAQAGSPSDYLYIPSIPGTSTAPGHANWINVNSMSWTVTHPAQSQNSRESSSPKDHGINWTQANNTSVTQLMPYISNDKPLPSTQFDIVPAGSKTGTPLMSLSTQNSYLTNLAINNDQASASTVSNAYTMTYNPAADGGTGNTISTTWNTSTGMISGPLSLAPTMTKGTHAAAVAGTTSMYLRLGGNTGSKIAGNSEAVGYENWIQLSSASMDVSNATSGSSSSLPSYGPLNWTQQIGGSLVPELANLLKGASLNQATLEYVIDGAAGPVTTMQINLNNVQFTNLQLDGTGQASESVGFSQMSEIAWQINPDGTRGASSCFDWNLVTMTGSTACSLAPSVSGFGTGNLSPSAQTVSSVPLPPSVWLFGSGIMGLIGIARRKKA